MRKLLDFDLAIEPLGDSYRTRVVASPAGEADADFALPFTDKDLEIFVLKVVGSVGRVRRKLRRIESQERQLLETFGGELFQAVFSGRVGECLGRSRLVADSKDAGLRIRLRLPSGLANIPWEFLYDAEYGFVGLSPETALVRYLEMPGPVRPFPISPPLRILAMISAPSDVLELSGAEEWEKLNAALSELADRGMVEVDRLEAGTLSALQRPLRLREYHVLHFVGHGGWDEDAQDGALALEGAGGATRLVTGRDLGVMIRDHHSLRLVVLNACEGARSARDDPFGGVAQALVRQGIPAVIAMQFEISDPAALVFSQSFYQAIADGLPVDVAMVEARRAMFAEGNEVEWATPVLYLRSPDGHVFARSRVSPAERQDLERAERPPRKEAEPPSWEDALRAQTDPGRQDPERTERPAREDTGLSDLTQRARSSGEAGDPAAARDQLAKLLPAYERVLGPEHPDTLSTRADLARWTGEAGDPAAARDQLAKLLPAYERVLGPEHPDTLSTRVGLARWTGEAGDAAAARDQAAALLPVTERVLGPDHPYTLDTRLNLAAWTGDAGDAAAARDQLARLLPVYERVLGPEHPGTLDMEVYLLRWTGEAGDAAAARDQLARLLPVYERVLGPEHPGTLITRHNFAAWTGQAGDAAAARDQLARLLPVYERVLGPEHPKTLGARLGLANWTGQAGDATAARDQAAALLLVTERVLGPEYPDTLAARYNLAAWTGQAGDAAAARDQLARLLPVYERVLGPEHPYTLDVRDHFAYWTERANKKLRWMR